MLEREANYQEKTIRMPSAEAMARTLECVHLPLRKGNVLKHFVSSVAGQEESSETLVSAWESACAEANRNLPFGRGRAITRLLHAYTFPYVIDALIPNKGVATDAKHELRTVDELRFGTLREFLAFPR